MAEWYFPRTRHYHWAYQFYQRTQWQSDHPWIGPLRRRALEWATRRPAGEWSPLSDIRVLGDIARAIKTGVLPAAGVFNQLMDYYFRRKRKQRSGVQKAWLPHSKDPADVLDKLRDHVQSFAKAIGS